MSEPDLNLFRVFDTLFELRSVTRAAERLSLTQSAVSHALKRLRQTFGDTLFVRAAGGLRPTARADEIAPRVREALGHLRGTLAPSLFDPASASRRFVIAAGAYFCALFIPELIATVGREAPGLSIEVAPVMEAIVTALDLDEVDIVLGVPSRLPSRLIEEILYEERMVWVAARKNPVFRQPIDSIGWATLPRVNLLSRRPFEAVPPIPTERLLGATHEPAVYDSTTAIAIVARTQLVALVPRRIAALSSLPIQIVEPEKESLSFGITMLWHGKRQADGGLAWLRGVIRRVTA